MTTTDSPVEQLEFYLGDSNLPRDRHLYELSAVSPINGMGTSWIPLSHIMTFGRMQPFLSSLGIENIVEMIQKQSKTLLVEKIDSEWKVRRKEGLVRRADERDRTVYIKGFVRPDGGGVQTKQKEEEKELQVEIEGWVKNLVVERLYDGKEDPDWGKGQVLAVRMRREGNKGNGRFKVRLS
jgi:hypothetical protein